MADQDLSDDRHRGWPGLVRQVSVGTEMRGPSVSDSCDRFPEVAHVLWKNAFTCSRTWEERKQTKGKCHCLAIRALVPMARSIGRSESPFIRAFQLLCTGVGLACCPSCPSGCGSFVHEGGSDVPEWATPLTRRPWSDPPCLVPLIMPSTKPPKARLKGLLAPCRGRPNRSLPSCAAR